MSIEPRPDPAASLLDKYAEHSTRQLNIPDPLDVPPISDYGSMYPAAVGKMHELLYAA
jgi:hypothetical protein